VTHGIDTKCTPDTLLAATYFHAGITSLLTLDAGDFGIFGCFQCLNPAIAAP
jgi:hypothetical protein